MFKAETSPAVDRRDERTHLFIIATLYSGQASIAVRVRNLSPLGALIEGSTLPPVGTNVVLRRGNLEAKGMLLWTESGHAGLSFSSSVTPSNWLPTKGPSRQRQVDRYIYGAKHARQPAELIPGTPVKAAKLASSAVVAGLESLQFDLSKLADKLAQDVILVATHPEVQFLDEAVQRIGRIVQAIRESEGSVPSPTKPVI